MAPEDIKHSQHSPQMLADPQVSDQQALDHFMTVDATHNVLPIGQDGIVLQVNDEQIFADLTVLSGVSSNSMGEARLNIMRSIETSESSLNLLSAVHQGAPTTIAATASHDAAVMGATAGLEIAETAVGRKGDGAASTEGAGASAASQDAGVAIGDDSATHIQIAFGRSAANAGDAGRLVTDTALSPSVGEHAAGTDGAAHGAPAATHLAGASSTTESPVAAMAAASLSIAALSINPGIALCQVSSNAVATAIDTAGGGHGTSILTAAPASVTVTTASVALGAIDAVTSAPAPQMALSPVAGLVTDHHQDPLDDEGFGARHGDGGVSWMDASERIGHGNHAHPTDHDDVWHVAAMHMTASPADITHAQFADSGGHHHALDPHHLAFEHIEKNNY